MLQDLIAYLFILNLSYILGFALLRHFGFRFTSRGETILYSVSLGLGTLGLLLMILGVAGILFVWVVFPLLLACFIFLILTNGIQAYSILKRKFKFCFDVYGILAITGLLYITYQFLNAMCPVINGDSIAWYLSIPKHYLEHHSILSRVVAEDYISSNLPLNGYMISALGMMLSSEIVSQMLLGWTMACLSTLAVFVSIKKLSDWRLALIGSVIFITMPTLAWLITSAKLDLGYVLFELCFWSLFISWSMKQDQRLLMLSGVFLGFAVATKYHSLITLTIVAFVLLVHYYSTTKSLISTIKSTYLFCAIVVCIACISYIKTSYFKGDPFFPFLSSPQLVEGEGFDVYKSLWEYPKYLYNMLFARDPWIKPVEFYDKPVGFLLITLLPFTFIRGRSQYPNRLFTITGLTYFIVLSIAVMFSVWPFPRHLLPAISVLLIIILSSSSSLLRNRFKSIIVLSLSVAVIATIIVANFKSSNLSLRVKYLTQSISKSEYLERTIFTSIWHPNKAMLDYIKTTDIKTRIVSLDYGNGYYVARPFLKKKYLYTDSDPMLILSKLRNDRITHLYLSEEGMDYLTQNFNKGQKSSILQIVSDNMILVYQAGNQKLYRIEYEGI